MTHQPTMALLSLPIAALVACGADDVATPDAGGSPRSQIDVVVAYTPRAGARTPVSGAEVVVTQPDGTSARATTGADGTTRVLVGAGDAVTAFYPDVAHAFTVLDVQPGDALVFDEPRPGASQSIDVVLPAVPGTMPSFDITTPCGRTQTVPGQTSMTLSVDAPCGAPMDISLEGYDAASGAYHGHALVTDATFTTGGTLDLSAVTLDVTTQPRSFTVAPIALAGAATVDVRGRYGRAVYQLGWEEATLTDGATLEVPLPGAVNLDTALVTVSAGRSSQQLSAPLIDGRAQLTPLASVTSATLTNAQLTMELDGTDTGDAVMAKLWDSGGNYLWTIVGAPDRRTLFVPPLRPFGLAAPSQGRVGLIDHPAVTAWDQLRAAPAQVDVIYDPIAPTGLRQSDLSFF